MTRPTTLQNLSKRNERGQWCAPGHDYLAITFPQEGLV